MYKGKYEQIKVRTYDTCNCHNYRNLNCYSHLFLIFNFLFLYLQREHVYFDDLFGNKSAHYTPEYTVTKVKK